MELFLVAVIFLYAYKGIYMQTRDWSAVAKIGVGVLYWAVLGTIFFGVIYAGGRWSELRENQPWLLDAILGAFFTAAFTCVVIAIFHLLDDISWVVIKLTKLFRSKPVEPIGPQVSRLQFLTTVGLGVGAVTMGSFFWGLTKGKFSFRVMNESLAFDNLPAAFHGMRIVQISDAHLGSFNNNFEPIKHAIEKINSLEPDYIFFTGDMINSHDSEAEPWVDIFAELKAKYGKYSILGNHDYAYYGDLSEEEQAAVKTRLIKIEERMGFKPLLNEHVVLEKDGEKIGLVGVENWGKSHWFPKLGDVALAEEGMEKVPFKILLSHDPTHWDEHVMGKTDIDLTLAGHTHGAQMGISIPGVLEISPAALMFKRWAGLYKEGKQQLYINRGFGYLIFPGRVGMSPEITVLELNKA